MKKVTTSKRAVAYVRTAQVGASTARQEAQCRELAEGAGLHIKAIYRDVGVSGLSKQRPGLLRLLRDIRRSRVDAVIAAAPDRIARSAPLALKIERQISRRGAELVDGSRGQTCLTR